MKRDYCTWSYVGCPWKFEHHKSTVRVECMIPCLFGLVSIDDTLAPLRYMQLAQRSRPGNLLLFASGASLQGLYRDIVAQSRM